MISFLKPYLGAIQAVAVLAAALALFAGGLKVGVDRVQVKWEADRLAQAEAAQDVASETRRAFDVINVNSRKEREHAAASIAALRADARSGAVRLSIPADPSVTGDSGVGNQKARTELLPATADDLVGLAGDADDAVRDLNECIDKYHSLSAR
jgi:hypothetical protein